MAIRTITVKGSEILGKKCKPIKDITERIKVLANDMIDTMLEADGVGLAAPQVGVMKRIFVARPYIDDEEADKFYIMVNPEIIEEEGMQESSEGCLSIPGYMGLVERPQRIKVKYTDIDGREITESFEDFAATVICHENDHLDGILYCDKAKDFMTSDEYMERLRELEEIEKNESDSKSEVKEDSLTGNEN